LTGIKANDASTLCTCSINDDNDPTVTACGSASFCPVIRELKKVNLQFSQLLDQLEKQAPRMYPLNAITSNPQQPAQTQSPQIPCINGVVPPALLPPAPTPDPQTAVLGKSPWDSHSSQTTIHNVTNMVESDWPFKMLLHPAPDPVDMVYTGALWPQPCPAWKTIPFKKKSKTKHTVMRCRDQDLHRPRTGYLATNIS